MRDRNNLSSIFFPLTGRMPVTLDIDADILDWLQEQPGWRREINELLRSYMETNLICEAAFEEVKAAPK
jgi:uncharacterized protein (DUF4415 family)